jgi:hypothetical protein
MEPTSGGEIRAAGQPGAEDVGMSRYRRICVVIATLLALLPSPRADAQADGCDRDCILAQVETYVSALVAHDPDLAPLAAPVRSSENGRWTQLGEGVWQTITSREGYEQAFIDDSLRSAVYFGAFREGDQPLLLAIRFGFEGGRIVELEHLVSRPDERNQLILRHQLDADTRVNDGILPRDQRVSRDALIAAANSYFDGIASSSDDGVPMHRRCTRRENGVLLLRNPAPETQPCPIGFDRFAYITKVRDRRVAVVDEARGLVLMWAFFDVPGDVPVAPRSRPPSDAPASDGAPRPDPRKVPRSLYIAELFRVESGLIREIEAIMFNLDLGAKSGWE